MTNKLPLIIFAIIILIASAIIIGSSRFPGEMADDNNSDDIVHAEK